MKNTINYIICITCITFICLYTNYLNLDFYIYISISILFTLLYYYVNIKYFKLFYTEFNKFFINTITYNKKFINTIATATNPTLIKKEIIVEGIKYLIPFNSYPKTKPVIEKRYLCLFDNDDWNYVSFYKTYHQRDEWEMWSCQGPISGVVGWFDVEFVNGKMCLESKKVVDF